MIIAAYRDTTYDVVLLLHIVAAFVAFAPAFVHPFLASQSSALDAAERGRVLGFMHANGRRIYAPALIVMGLLGFALQGLSDGVIEFDQTWFWLAIASWLAMNGILHALLLPAERAVAGGDESAARRVDAGGALLTLLFLFTLYLMVFQPGL